MLTAALKATAEAPPANKSASLLSAKFPQATNRAFFFPALHVGDGLTVHTIFEGKISARSSEISC